MLIFLCGGAAAVSAAYLAARRLNPDNEIIFDILAVVLPLSEIWKQILLTRANGGSYQWWYFPFQLCSMPLYLLPIRQVSVRVFRKDSRTVRVLTDFLVDFGLLGGLFAFADQSGMHYALKCLTVHSYLWHFTMIFLGFCLIFSGRHSGSLKNYKAVSALFLCLASAAEIINALFHSLGEINMFYISPWEPVTQVILRDIAGITGTLPEIIIYLALILIGGFLIHLLSALASGRSCAAGRIGL